MIKVASSLRYHEHGYHELVEEKTNKLKVCVLYQHSEFSHEY